MLGIDNRSSDAIILGCAPKLALSWALVFVGPSPYSPGRSAAGACEGSSIALSTMRRVVRGPVGSLLGKGPGVRRPRKTPTVSLSKRARTGGKAYAPTYTSLGPRTVTLYCATSRTLPTKERGSDISATRGQLRVTRCHTAHIRRLQHQTDMSYGAAITRHVRLAAALVLI